MSYKISMVAHIDVKLNHLIKYLKRALFRLMDLETLFWGSSYGENLNFHKENSSLTLDLSFH